ncbi:MAG: lytic transglycosylase domain-containing protein [Betaproteobacteria bacterium]|nr:MAG: lytic transglycosylase domain-containing protein [Betaproteobacteria bacterium]
MRRVLVLGALLLPLQAWAGAQLYEPLADSVVTQLAAAVADQAPPVFNFRNAGDAHKWVHAMSERLRRRIPDRKERIELLKAVQHEATRAGLDPQLVLGLIEIESGFRKYATSIAGARGYMQVMPFWTKLLKRPGDNLYRLRINLRYGCVILRHYLDLENGDFFRALGRYNGSLGKPEYPNLVQAAWRGRWQYDGATN